MNCKNCGQPLNENNQCPKCDYVTVEKMSAAEATNFQGVTIEDENNKNYEHHQYHSESSFRTRHRPTSRIKTFQFGLNSSTMAPWKKYLYLAGGVALIAFFLFVALPFIITAIGIGVLVYMILKFILR